MSDFDLITDSNDLPPPDGFSATPREPDVKRPLPSPLQEWGDSGRIRFGATRDHLVKILARHTLWVQTNGTEGERLDLRGANLVEAALDGADLWRASLRKTNLAQADLREANLDRAVLWKANLSGADLGETNLCTANLRGSDLSGAKMETARGVQVSKNPLSGHLEAHASKAGDGAVKYVSSGPETDP